MFAWKRRLRPAGEHPVAGRFKPVKVVSETLEPRAEQPDSAIELCLCGGRCGGGSHQRRVIVRRGFDRQALIDLVQALESLA